MASSYISVAAASIANAKSLPSVYPAFSTALHKYFSASSSSFRLGANPPSSPTPHARPSALSTPFSVWYTSAHQRNASLKFLAPIGIIINSCTLTELSACLPPLSTFIIGTGRVVPLPMYLNKDFDLPMADALSAASDTPSMAFAPNLPLLCVPSSLIINSSMPFWSSTSWPFSALAISLFTWPTAFSTDLPKYFALLPSLSSTASNEPVDAPLGTLARAMCPPATKSTSTVGLPRLSNICLALMLSIFI